MATVRPFKGIRPINDKAHKVVTLPYDVMNRKEASEMAQGNPYSFLHVSRAEIDLPECDPYAPQVYEKAKENLEAFLRDGIFVEEDKPCLYIYRQTMGKRIQTGIVGCVSVDEYANNTIKKHELTRVEKEEDRIKHFDVCNTNTEPVFLTYRENPHIRKITEDYANSHEPEYDFICGDGIGHCLWRIQDEDLIQSLCQAFSHVDDLYIADGHHRSVSAFRVGQMRRREKGHYTGQEEFNYFMAVLYSHQDLKIYDYNRVIKDLNGNTVKQFLQKIQEAGFTVEEKGTEPFRPQACHQFSLYLEGKWYSLTAKSQIIPQDVVGSLDVSILQDKVLAPILGIKDPRTDNRIDFVGGIRGLSALARRADTDMKLAFALYPVTLETLMKISDVGEIMPPKSTWFEPKIGSGLFLHRL